MEQFKIRASGSGKIAGIKGLGETGKTFCKEWLKQKLYKRRKDIKSKYIDKGNRNEEDGFTLMALELDLGMVYKNLSYFQSEHFCGTPDLIHNGIVYDNKCSWDLSTFPMFETEIPNKDYWWQLQVYMELTGCRKATLAYTLIDADMDLIDQSVKWETDPEKIYQTICNMVYTQERFDEAKTEYCSRAESDFFVEIPAKNRIKTFSFDYDPEAILKLQERVEECREYISSLLTNK
jgi:hypothetical protein